MWEKLTRKAFEVINDYVRIKFTPQRTILMKLAICTRTINLPTRSWSSAYIKLKVLNVKKQKMARCKEVEAIRLT